MGEGRECHDDGRSVTMGHDDLKIATGRLLDGNGTVMGQLRDKIIIFTVFVDIYFKFKKYF